MAAGVCMYAFQQSRYASISDSLDANFFQSFVKLLPSIAIMGLPV